MDAPNVAGNVSSGVQMGGLFAQVGIDGFKTGTGVKSMWDDAEIGAFNAEYSEPGKIETD